MSRLLAKELDDLREAKDRFFRRAINLFEQDGTPKHSQEEIGRRMAEFERQFELTARRLERRADNMETGASKVLSRSSSPPADDDTEAKKAEIRLKAVASLRKALATVRAEVARTAAGEDPDTQPEDAE